MYTERTIDKSDMVQQGKSQLDRIKENLFKTQGLARTVSLQRLQNFLSWKFPNFLW